MSYLQTYLDALPQGEDSYPDYLQKAAVYRQFLDLMPMAPVADVLPAPLRHLVLDPEPVSAWIPEVHLNAVYLAARDVAFVDDQAYRDHWRRVNETLLSGRLYRMLMRVASPTVVIRGAGSRWSSFHRGVGLHLDRVNQGQLAARLTYPAHLIPEPLAESYAMALQVALEVAGARSARIVAQAYTPTEISLVGSWS